jgi:nitrate/TMAO reductase-like tetraheme cytochrome c subunit
MIALFAAVVLSAATQPTSCISCHGSELFQPQDRAKVQQFQQDVHAQVGLSCHDCHGGNRDSNADTTAAMDPKFAQNPYIGTPKRTQIPDFCGRCHRSVVTEYRTSVHGQRLARGDDRVATCTDCHSVHDIRRKSNPDAPVYATHVAETCSGCHSDPKRMAAYHIPTDQYARWSISVHAKALFEKNDLTAPTCNDCHGNHGATPSGVLSVSLVCSNCHAREAEWFRKSPKSEGWTRHNELLATGSKCGDCHEDARAKIQLTHFSECITCHENHSVIRPGVAMMGMLPDVPCAFCHEGAGSLAALVPEPRTKAVHYRQVRDQLLSAAARLQLTGDARFDWLVDQALRLPTHRTPPARTGEESPLRPEFARLFDKFRIGKTHTIFQDRGGRTVNVSIRRCSDCHLASDAAGTANARQLLGATRGLTSMIARAERIQLAAHRGGVETRQAQNELDNAVDNQIELETLVHTFAVADVQKKEQEGLQHAQAALVSAQKSLDELTYRRTGLFVALGIIILVLIGLALKIRMLS